MGPGPLGPTYASWLEKRHPGGYEAIYEQRRKPEYRGQMGAIEIVLPMEEYVDTWIAEESIEFMRYPGSNPFFLWCGFCGPHAPNDPPKPYSEMYPFDEMPMPKQRTDDPPASPKGRPNVRWKEDETLMRRWLSYYWGMTSLIDDRVGRMVSMLEERGILDNTLIVFTSDHGTMAGDYNMFNKGNFYEEVLRVPTIVVPPGGGGASPRIDGLVETSDLAATILDYAGVEVPLQMSAQSLRPLMEGNGEPREAIFCEYMTASGQKSKCVRTERYKYVFWGGEEEGEFYDLQEDPDELRNLYRDPGYRAEVDRHRGLMLDILTKSERPHFCDETPSPRDLQIWLQ